MMTSARRIAANRENAKKSTGPRTRRGKSRASRNAARHGLEGINFGVVGLSKKVARLAKIICRDASDPFRYEQALIIAESQILLARVRAARISALENSRTPIGASPILPGDPTVRRRRPFLDGQQEPEPSDRVTCIRRALPELLRLERYERRALSRRKRAIRRFDALGE